MQVTLTAKRQVTFPASVLSELGVSAGDRLEIVRTDAGFLIRPKRADLSKLGLLRGKIKRGVKPFDVAKFRESRYDATLRD
jgi:AbrB family looped-hinge helix DNA binding protein